MAKDTVVVVELSEEKHIPNLQRNENLKSEKLFYHHVKKKVDKLLVLQIDHNHISVGNVANHMAGPPQVRHSEGTRKFLPTFLILLSAQKGIFLSSKYTN